MQNIADNDPHAPYTVYKSDISYFSGKLEAYIRTNASLTVPVEVDRHILNRIAANTGVKKMPAVRTADGKWLFDTTPMLCWFEKRYTVSPILPADPALAFLALLIEDYGDEWLWRPAMWWRWMPRISRLALGQRIAAEMISPLLAGPGGWYFGRRQLKEWLWDDGVTTENAGAVRDMLFREFEFLEPLLEDQPFLLGSHPSIADFGYFGSMFRHFGNDPDSSEVMRRQAPNTYEWLARLWNAKAAKLPHRQQWVWPDAGYWGPLLGRIANDYLPYLHQNAVAYKKGADRFNYRGATMSFPNTKTTVYRVWCREVLQQRYELMQPGERGRVADLFSSHGGLAALFDDGAIESGLAERFILPRDPEIQGKFRSPLKVAIFGQPRN